ncbi:MAG: glucose 1-dehydrogenase [Pseudomonadales bacterium]|nr:glucose 1-dehydrogenase [Pseudomonadales bacterium]
MQVNELVGCMSIRSAGRMRVPPGMPATYHLVIVIFRMRATAMGATARPARLRMARQLQDKVAIVTGGASGIGRATAALFVAEGAKVVVADIQEEKGRQVVARLGADSAFRMTDVSVAAEVQALIDFATDRFGRLDVMFNNAGVAGSTAAHAFCENDFHHFEAVMSVDLLGPMLGAKYAARYMARHGGGSIISTASIAASCAGYGLPEYRAAKAGVVALSRSLAIEFAEHNIRVNTISPGAIPTDIFAESTSGSGIPPELVEQVIAVSVDTLLDWQALKRKGRPEDIAEAALFLASDRSAFITGIDLVVDGGASLPDKVNRAALLERKVAVLLGQA